jgi:hypothetical protein
MMDRASRRLARIGASRRPMNFTSNVLATRLSKAETALASSYYLFTLCIFLSWRASKGFLYRSGRAKRPAGCNRETSARPRQRSHNILKSLNLIGSEKLEHGPTRRFDPFQDNKLAAISFRR